MKTPKISILMGVYNCEATLAEAIESIQKQTFPDWELIICDDGSADGTCQLARRYSESDCRIRVLQNACNRGLNHTLNRCLKCARGDYIARQDGDDTSLPERLEVELTFLEGHPEFDLVSSSMIFFDEQGEWGRNYTKEYPQAGDLIRGSPICHAPVLMRRSCIERVGGYTEDPRMLRVEDVNLWIKLYAQGCRCYNIPEPLYRMRNDKNAFRRRKYRYRINSAYVRLLGCRQLGLGGRHYAAACKPLVVGLVPAWLRRYLRRRQQG